MRRVGHAIAFCLTLFSGAAMAETTYTLLNFSDLNGWAEDDHSAAFTAFKETCDLMSDPEWTTLCNLANDVSDARGFFELFFKPVMVTDGEPMLFTGYFEPELRGSLQRTATFRYPIYRLPRALPPTGPWLTRQEIEENGALASQGLEIAWLADPVDRFFLQVQGSGRIRLQDGSVIRVGYAGNNRRPYSSIGQELIRRGTYSEHQVSATVIRNWVRNNPDEGRALLWTNESYVFFRNVTEVPAEKGPLGAMNRSISAMRSIAVDPAYTTLGAPVWIERHGANSMNRLMIAQDTGSAIKGAQRADILIGTGVEAGLEAGEIKDTGRMIMLLPIQTAYALVPEVI